MDKYIKMKYIRKSIKLVVALSFIAIVSSIAIPILVVSALLFLIAFVIVWVVLAIKDILEQDET